MKKFPAFLLALALPAHAGTAVADFNDLTSGDLSGQTGGSGFGAAPWINNSATTPVKFLDVIAGDLTAPPATHYAVPQSGTAHSVQNTDGTTSMETRTLSPALTGDTVWFSFLLKQPSASAGSNAGSRGGICFNQPTTSAVPNNPRVMALGSQLNAWLTGSSQIALNSIFTADTTALVVGRILVNDSGNDTLSLWVNPDVNAIGAPLASYSTADFIGTTGITTVSVQSYGGGNGGAVDGLRISDAADAYNQVTGSTIPDPVLDISPTSTAVDFRFGPIYPGTTTRTVTFLNEGPNNPITLQNVTLTNNASGVFSIDNVMPAVGTSLSPGQTVNVRVLASSASGGDFTGELFIDTDSTTQDKVLPVTASVFAPGAKVNPNPTLDNGIAGWTAAAAVSPGIALGSTGMARVRGKGDSILPADETDSFGQSTTIPDGAVNWELGCHFTPIRAADFSIYTGNPADSSFVDRTFQLAIFNGNDLPATSMSENQALNALIQIAYLPAGNGSDPQGFFVFDGSSWKRLNSLPAIQGSVDADFDGRLAPDTDTVKDYRLNVRGTGFGTASATYSVTVSGGELAAPVTQSNIPFSAGPLISSAMPGSFTFTTSDLSTLSNGNGGYCTPFWVDDVFYYANALPEPSLTVAGTGSINGVNEATPSATLTLRNDGRSQNLNVTAVAFSHPALTLVSPTLPINLAAGASVPLQVRLNSTNLAPNNALMAGMTVTSNDPSQPVATVLLTATSTSSSNLLPNWNFETAGSALGTGDNFALWQEYDVRTRPVPGILPGSATSVYLDSTGGTTSISQPITPLADFDVTAGFAIRATANRAFSVKLVTTTGQLNLRYLGSILSAYDGAAWQPLIDLTSSPLATSIDTNFDGDFLDPGESFTAYKIHLTGSGWGTASATYQVRILNAAGTPVASGAAPFSFFQTKPTTPLSTVQFDNFEGTNPGFWIDDVLLKSTTPVTSGLQVTAFTVNKTTGTVSISFTSTAGTAYTVTAANDLATTAVFSPVSTITGSAGTTIATFSDPAVTAQPKRFYRVEAR